MNKLVYTSKSLNLVTTIEQLPNRIVIAPRGWVLQPSGYQNGHLSSGDSQKVGFRLYEDLGHIPLCELIERRKISGVTICKTWCTIPSIIPILGGMIFTITKTDDLLICAQFDRWIVYHDMFKPYTFVDSNKTNLTLLELGLCTRIWCQ